MTYNEAIVEAREKASKTSKSWFIFSDRHKNYHVGDSVKQVPGTATPSRPHDMHVMAVVNPIWQE